MNHRNHLQNERGSTIVVVFLVLGLITVIGVSSMNDSLVEVGVATNDLLHKQSFYLTDGAFELVAELLEQNIEASIGFEKEDPNDDGVTRGAGPWALRVLDPHHGRPGHPDFSAPKNLLDFWQNEVDDIYPYNVSTCPLPGVEFEPGRPRFDNMDMYFPAHLALDDVRNALDNDPPSPAHTRIRLGGETFFTEGAAIEMAAGYSGGGGKSAAGGGSHRLYTIHAHTIGARYNHSLMAAQYRHVIGQE